jgi:hypothetical protein
LLPAVASQLDDCSTKPEPLFTHWTRTFPSQQLWLVVKRWPQAEPVDDTQRPTFGVQVSPEGQVPQEPPQPSSPHCLPPQSGIQADGAPGQLRGCVPLGSVAKKLLPSAGGAHSYR